MAKHTNSYLHFEFPAEVAKLQHYDDMNDRISIRSLKGKYLIVQQMIGKL